MARKHSPSSGTNLALWPALAALVVVLDQLAKWLILRSFHLGGGTRITSFFNLIRAENRGAAFSFLAGAGGWQRWLFTAIAVAAAVVIIALLRKHAREKLFCFSLALILGGALGNLLDRITHGYVVDFLDFHWAFLQPLFYGGHFPAFNLADSAITAGAIGLVVHELWFARGKS